MKRFLPVLAALCWIGCAASGAGKAAKRVTLMTFNVENLFDTSDDPGKEDETFLPLSEKRTSSHRNKCLGIEVKKWREQCLSWDWSPEALAGKMENLSEVVRSVGDGRGPDILALQEVENLSVLKQWKETYLAGLSYQDPILIEGEDVRGIDVALLTKLKSARPPLLHRIPFDDMDKRRKKDTRGILEATLMLPDGKHMTVFVVHFPAPFHPAHVRRQALLFLNDLTKKKTDSAFVVALGDFNIPSEEDAATHVLDDIVAPAWLIAHRFCGECLGTTYYLPKKSWSFLDMILVSKTIEKTRWNIMSARVVQSISKQKDAFGHPRSYDWPSYQGVSDHFPLAATLSVR